MKVDNFLISFWCLFHCGLSLSLRSNSNPAQQQQQGQGEYEKIELTNPMRLQPIIAIPYESTLKVIIQLRLPELLGNNGEDLVAATMKKVLDEYRFTKVASSDQRFPVNSVLSKTSNYIVGTDQQIQSYVQVLGENDIPGFSVYSFNSTDFDDHFKSILDALVSQAMEDSGLAGQPLKSAPETAIIRVTTIMLNYIRGVAEACLNRRIPTGLFNSYLQEKLINFILDHNFLEPDYKPSFSIESFENILDQSVSDCLLTDTRMYIVINVPIVRRQAKWHIYEAHHSRFMYDGKVCSVGGVQNNNGESRFYAFDLNTENIIELDDLTLETTCQLNNSTSLCYIPHIRNSPPPTSVDSKKLSTPTASNADDSSLSCATGILNKLTLKELKDLCMFRCKSIQDGEYFIDQPTPDSVLLTNIKRVKIVCPNYNITKNFERIGTLKIQVQPDDCYLWADEEFFPLPSKAQKEQLNAEEDSDLFQSNLRTKNNNSNNKNKSPVEASYLIPLTWTKNNAYSMYSEDNISFKIKNYKEIIDFEWLKKFEEEEEASSREEEEDGYGAKHWNFFDDDYVE